MLPAMALIAGLLGIVGRFAGKVLTAALGWASVLLFGRLSKTKQTILAGVTLLSLAWLAAVVGVLLPDVGTFLLAAIPRPSFVGQDVVRLAMLVIAILAPLVVGALVLFLDEGRPKLSAGAVLALIRGYPLAFALDLTLIWLAVVGAWLKVRALAHRWEDAHVPIVIKPGRYDAVVEALAEALGGSGLHVDRRAASRAISIPTTLLVQAAGKSFESMVPERLANLYRTGFDMTVHPADLAMTGEKHQVEAARAAVASRLASADAYMTSTGEAQRIEDRLKDLIGRVKNLGTSGDRGVRNGLREVDEALSTEDIEYDDWQVLYRVRLQVERDLLVAERERDVRGGGAPVA